MRIICLTSLDELAPYADDWDRLAAGMPFRGWTWLSSWWRHYGPLKESDAWHRRLTVLCAFDDADALVGVAPWYLETSALHGRVLRALGSGEICSDYLGILCQPSLNDTVIGAMADFLVEQNSSRDPAALQWDLLELDGIDASDQVMAALISHLSQNGCRAFQRPAPSCWNLCLPTQWDAYLAILSKNLRRDAKRLERDWIDTGRAVLHSAEGLGQLPYAMNLLQDLHQRRRRSLGEAGCFASPKFAAFYRNAAPKLFLQGNAEFYWLELDGQPVAAEFQLVGNGILYEYQSGIDPDAKKYQPGKLLNLAILRRAIERGYREYDFLRGDEPYKARFGAKSKTCFEIRVAPRRAGAELRNHLWLAGSHVKQWMNRELSRWTDSPRSARIFQEVSIAETVSPTKADATARPPETVGPEKNSEHSAVSRANTAHLSMPSNP